MQQAEDAPGADERAPSDRNGEAIPADSLMQVGQAEQRTMGTAAGSESLQTTVEDGPVEEGQGAGNESGAAIGTSILQERSEAAESSASQDSRSPDTHDKTPVGNVDTYGQRIEDATERTVVSAAVHNTQPSARPEQRPGGQIGVDSATQATLQPQLLEQHEERSRTSDQPLTESADIAPLLLPGDTSVSQSAVPADNTSTAQPAALQATSTAQTLHADNAPPSSNAQTEEGDSETDGPPIPIEHARQPYSSQPGSARYGPAGSGDATSGQSSAGAAARGMPMRES